jgi:hypothetical protein
MRTRPSRLVTSLVTRADWPISASTPNRRRGARRLSFRTAGRTTTTPTAEIAVKAMSCTANGSPINARPVVIRAATDSIPSAAVRVKISVAPSATATISQISH